jgi:hypothetical protein
VNLKRVLRQIEPDPRDSRQIPDRLAHRRLPFGWVDDNDHLGTLMPFGAPSTPSFVDAVAKGANRPDAAIPGLSRQRKECAHKRSFPSKLIGRLRRFSVLLSAAFSTNAGLFPHHPNAPETVEA